MNKENISVIIVLAVWVFGIVAMIVVFRTFFTSAKEVHKIKEHLEVEQTTEPLIQDDEIDDLIQSMRESNEVATGLLQELREQYNELLERENKGYTFTKDYTLEEIIDLRSIVYAESGDEPYAGMVLTAKVVMNRARNRNMTLTERSYEK